MILELYGPYSPIKQEFWTQKEWEEASETCNPMDTFVYYLLAYFHGAIC